MVTDSAANHNQVTRQNDIGDTDRAALTLGISQVAAKTSGRSGQVGSRHPPWWLTIVLPSSGPPFPGLYGSTG